MSVSGELELAAWRRSVSEAYATVRRSDDHAAAREVWRLWRDDLFRSSSQSPLAADHELRASGIPYWPYEPALRFAAVVVPVEDPKHYSITTGEDEVTRIRQIGWVELGAPVSGRLAVWWLEQYGGGIFVPFRDATAGHATYGAGRYLLDTAKGADLGSEDDRLVLDFNFSYHPSCRYDDAWQCPLAPPENVLSAAIEAGEKLSPV
jgi:uncharacterized protein (DUF1684 family)